MPDLGCSPNAAVIYDFLLGKGLLDFQAAAVVGNLQQESRLNPRLQAIDTNGLPGRGIAMWQPPRWQNLVASSRDPWGLEAQLEFLWHELQTHPDLGLAPLLATSSLEDAVIVFQNRFEKPRADRAATSKRIDYARAALYACPSVKPPKRRILGAITAAVSVAALVAAAGYGAYKAVRYA